MFTDTLVKVLSGMTSIICITQSLLQVWMFLLKWKDISEQKYSILIAYWLYTDCLLIIYWLYIDCIMIV